MKVKLNKESADNSDIIKSINYDNKNHTEVRNDPTYIDVNRSVVRIEINI